MLYAQRGIVMASRLSVTMRYQSKSHTLEFLENNFTVSYSGVWLFADRNIMDLLQSEYLKFWPE